MSQSPSTYVSQIACISIYRMAVSTIDIPLKIDPNVFSLWLVVIAHSGHSIEPDPATLDTHDGLHILRDFRAGSFLCALQWFVEPPKCSKRVLRPL